MPRDKDLPKKYDIPRERYRELKYFCLQYPRKKERAKDTYALSAAAPSGMPSLRAALIRRQKGQKAGSGKRKISRLLSGA